MRYVWRDGAFRDPRTDEPMEVPERSGVCMPAIQSDIEDYQSPIDGSRVSSRTGQRYDLAKNDCVLAGPSSRPFIREEYVERKARQAKLLEARKAAK